MKIYRILLLLGLSLGAAVSHAHPHSFLDIKNHVLIENGKLSGFKLSWILDEITSAELLYEIKSDPQKNTQKILAEMDNSAVDAHYFSELYDDQNRPLKFKNRPADSRLEIQGNRVIYHFTLRLAEPQAVAARRFSFYTFEPSYYLAMEYNSPNDLTITEQSACRAELVMPKVSQDLRLYASRLDKADSPDEQKIGGSLGAMFAQKVSVQCQ